MSKWIDFSLDERKAMIQGVVEARQIDEAAAEKDWWVTAVLYALFHSSVSEYLLFKGGTSLRIVRHSDKRVFTTIVWWVIYPERSPLHEAIYFISVMISHSLLLFSSSSLCFHLRFMSSSG